MSGRTHRTHVRLIASGLVIAWCIGSAPEFAVARGAKPCAASLVACPAQGCAKKGTPDAFLNEGKRRLPASATAIYLSFENLARLQEIVDDLGILQGSSSRLTRQGRKRLKNLELDAGTTVGEGDFVEIVGYLAPDRTIKPAGPESVNCRLAGDANNDIHLPIVEFPNDTEYEAIVVEPIPQARGLEWTVANLRKAQAEKRLLRVRGQLFYDNKHKVRDDPNNEEGLKNQPKRFTLWEVHPVTQILACKRPANDCDRKKASEWETLN